MNPKMLPAFLLLLLAACGGKGECCAGCGQDGAAPGGFTLPADPKNYAPIEKYEAMKIPADNPLTLEKATLGWKLWFDKRLSGDGTRSCYGCHVNEKGLTDGVALNKGAYEKALTRHTPTLWNIGYHAEWYWDGRAKTLEAQAMGAWKLANMGAKDKEKDEIRADVVAKLNEVYKDDVQKVFGGPATAPQFAQALASFMRTIVSKTTPWDKFIAGDKTAISEAAQRGFMKFQNFKCTNCHVGLLLTNQQFHNVGIGLKDGKPSDPGRFTVTKLEKDTGAFKTPTLRDVARSAPYFHDGSVATLEEAVKFMLGGGGENPYLDKVNLQKQESKPEDVADLVEFLKSLSETARIPEPKLP